MLERGLRRLREELLRGDIRSVDLVKEALDRISDPDGEGARTFTLTFAERALAEAEQADVEYARGEAHAKPLLGVPISVKDLFDIAGEVTTAGSVALRSSTPARDDALVVRRLRNAGAIIVGRTNMTEFAFSGLGLNPHFGTPRNPWDRESARIPGGSSSGAAVSVADRMCAAAIGTDTGGSIRIPAALCGLTGFKPTQAAVPMEGTFALSPTLDSIGPIARSVEDCEFLFNILSESESDGSSTSARPQMLVPTNYFGEGADDAVHEAFEAAVERLEAGGWRIERKRVAAFDSIADMGRVGTFPAIEAYAAHRELLERLGDLYDPRVRVRIAGGERAPADALPTLHAMRATLIEAVAGELGESDGLLVPTVPIVAPPIASLEADHEYARVNLLMLRNTTAINLLDGCAVSLPISLESGAPVGISLAGLAGSDRYILALAHSAERLLC